MTKEEQYLKRWGFHPKDFNKPLDELGLTGPVLQWLTKYEERFNQDTEEGIVLMGNPRITSQVTSRLVLDMVKRKAITKRVISVDIPTYLIRYQLYDISEKAQQEQKLFELMDLCDLVIYQEMGLTQLTPTQQSRLYTLIQARYAARKPFIVTTVCDAETLELNLGQSIYYRIVSPNQILELVNGR